MAANQMTDGRTIVFFDLETTGLGPSECDIIQVGAVCMGRVFNSHSIPNRPIEAGATQVNGFTVVNNTLFRRGDPVSTVPIVEALRSFIAFLGSFGGSRVLLAAHNGKNFDVPVLLRVLKGHNLLGQFGVVSGGFLDTLELSRILHPHLQNHNLSYLVRHFLQENFDAHNGVEDARMLQQLFERWQPSEQSIRQCVFSPPI